MRHLRVALGLLCLLAAGAASAQSGKVEVQYLGHSAFKFTSVSGKVIVIDPFLTQNPKGIDFTKNLDNLGKVDLLLVTHTHGDHLGDAAEIAKRNKAPIFATTALNRALISVGAVPAELTASANKGGRVSPIGPGITITMTHAEHTSELSWKNPTTGNVDTHYGGEPIGYVIEFENGFKVYHGGDTGLFGDMKLIGELYKPDMVLLPIGGHFVMNPQDAAVAVRDYLKPKYAVPMHYGTFAPLKGTPEEFEKALVGVPVKVLPMKPLDKLSF